MYGKCSTKTKEKIKVAPWGYLRGSMVISFFGHKDYYYDDAVKAAAYSFVRKVAKGQVSFFVGCYGGFDKMSYDLAVRFKKEVDSTAKIVFVTPYLDENTFHTKPKSSPLTKCCIHRSKACRKDCQY